MPFYLFVVILKLHVPFWHYNAYRDTTVKILLCWLKPDTKAVVTPICKIRVNHQKTFGQIADNIAYDIIHRVVCIDNKIMYSPVLHINNRYCDEEIASSDDGNENLDEDEFFLYPPNKFTFPLCSLSWFSSFLMCT